MESISLFATRLFAVPVISYIFLKFLCSGRRDKRLPPGPPTIPFLGNAHQMPSKGLHLKIVEWSKEYGKIFSLKIGSGTMICLMDREAVHELMDKRSAMYSDRPIDQNSKIALGEENLALMHTSPMWRAQRKLAAQNLSPSALKVLASVQEAEICQLMYDLLNTPNDFSAHIKRTTASVASIRLFGHRAKTFDSFWIMDLVDKFSLISETFEFGSYLPVDQFPILKLIPDSWAPSKARAKECFRKMSTVWIEALDRVIERRRKSVVRDSLADTLLDGNVKLDVPHSHRQLANLLGAIDQGAADTTAIMLRTSILFLAKNPWVQRKAQQELDRLCGTERMPTWEDFKELPYINCIIKEGLRIQPVIPTGIPHRAGRDDWYKGMLIPKDSVIIFSPYAIHRVIYEDPETYNPDRYLNHPRLAMDYAGSPDFDNRDHYSYGAGRRICVGIHLAERTQWRVIAKMLWAFNIEPGVDEEGKPIELDVTAYKDGFAHEPKPFVARFVPRSEKHTHIIQNNLKNMEDFLKQWE
ncbi:cytochrome P450 oxidoreductase-like protein [Lojkania enalia]|uniref:Cytochrome P450 oxidoreductase-like protein n=1 Tax=Lojkania enalia TaxID=147567 RepID=A0A9P4NA36_9PLEO|nr:cytochrome P450 oxidoreductase-like protein [Didymosphaeria enalia]